MGSVSLLVLVISSRDLAAYEGHRAVWRERMAASDVAFRFVEMGARSEEVGDTLFVQGSESLHPGVLLKTLAAFERYCADYDYLLRTNLSSLWFLDRFLPVVASLPRRRLYAGVVVEGWYASGAGLLLSGDAARLVVAGASLWPRPERVDDVDIGWIAGRCGLALVPLRKFDVPGPAAPVELGHYHYYVKTQGAGDRCLEAATMRRIVRLVEAAALS